MNDSKNISSFLDSKLGIQILDQSSTKIAVVDENFILKYFNPATQKNAFLFGFNKLEVGMKVFPKFDAGFWVSVKEKAMDGETLNFNYSYLIGDKKYTDLMELFLITDHVTNEKLIVFQSKNIDSHHLSDKGLLESQSMFRSFFETSPVGITIRKFETQELITFNSKICELFGCTHEKFRTLQRSDLVHKEDKKKMAHQMKLLGEGAIKSFRIEKQYKNVITGKIFWGVATRSLFKIRGEVYQMGILEDISIQKKTEEKLIKNEAKLKGIFNSTKDRVFAIDKNLKLIDANQSALQVLGHFGLGKTEGIKLEEFDFSKHLLWLLPHFKKAFKGIDTTLEREFFFEEIHYTDLITISPIKNNKDKIIGASVYGKDITEVKNIQKALAESKTKLLQAERLAKLGYWELDIENLMMTWSEELSRILGYAYEIKKIPLSEYYKLSHPDDLDQLKKALDNAIHHGTSFELKKRKIHQNGSIIYTVGRGEVLIKDGQVTKVFGSIQDVTKESNFENTLQKNEAKIRAIFNSTDDKIFAVDTNFNLIDFNESAARTLPQVFEVEKLEIGLKMLPKNPDSRKNLIGHYKKVLKGNSAYFDDSFKNKDGKIITDFITASPIQNEAGEIIGISIYGKNISELQEAKKKASETQIQLEDAQKLGKIGTVVYETKSQNLTWSIGALLLIDFEKNDTPPTFQECITMVHPEDISSLTEVIFALLNKGEPIDQITRTFTKTGRLIYVKTKANAIFEGKDLVTIEATIQDVTWLKEIEQNIQNTKQKYRDLFDNVNDAIVITNQDGVMIDCNLASEKLLGYSIEELKKLSIKDIVHPDDRERSKIYLDKLIKDGFYTDYQGRTIAKDGSIRYLQVNSNAILDEKGKMIGSRDIVRDISQLKKAEEKREQLLVELAEVNKELKDFAYIVSHDLKAPLRAINNISHWLSDDYADVLDEKGQQQLKLLINRVNRMHEFINGIFEYTKMSRVKESKEIIDLNEVIHDTALMLNLKENVQLNVLKKLPNIYGEKIKIEQVFQNLISNAIKYNDKEICKIDIDFENLKTHFLFRITDNGMGIEKKNFEKIFQIFQTLQSKDDFESTGIGLTIVKRIIQLHGGQISVKSELGKSTTFEFTIEK